MPTIPPRRTGPDYRHKRDRTKPKDPYFDPLDPASWGFNLDAGLSDLMGYKAWNGEK
jgi:hypothetical protein